MDQDELKVSKRAKKQLGQYPTILTSHLVNNPYAFFCQESPINPVVPILTHGWREAL